MLIDTNGVNYLDFINSFQARTILLPEVEAAVASGKGRFVSIRHDIDDFDTLEKVFLFARTEFENGIQATYFFLHTAPWFDYQMPLMTTLTAVRRWGHDIGFHNNALSVLVDGNADLPSVIDKPLRFLRQYGPVRYTSCHGSKKVKALQMRNYQIWTESGMEGPYCGMTSLKDAGFDNEVYFMPWTHSWSDSGRKWHGGPLNGVSRPWFEFDLPIFEPGGLEASVKEFNALSHGVGHILVHPIWWTNAV